MAKRRKRKLDNYIRVDPKKLKAARPEYINAAKLAEDAGITKQLLSWYETDNKSGRLVPEGVLDYLCEKYGVERTQVQLSS